MNFRFNFGALKALKNNVKREFGEKIDGGKFIEQVVNTTGHRFLARVIQRTPVDTGNLRKNWEIGKHVKRGFNHTITVENDVEYLEYVEYGHKQEVGRYVPELGKRLVKPWVEGQHFVEKTKMEMEDELPKIIEELTIKKLSEITK